MTVDEILLAAWRRGAPQCDQSRGFPRGFWPDVARKAVEIALGQETDFRQTMCERGDAPEVRRSFKGLDLDKLEINI